MITYKRWCFVSDKPVTCYKLMYLINHDGATDASAFKFRSEYMGWIYTLGKEYHIREGENFPEANPDGERMIVERGFHSYVNKEDTYYYSAHENSFNSGNPFSPRLAANPLVIVMCEIPAGARYWVGDEGGILGYCSERIKVVAWKRWYMDEWTRAVPPAGTVQT